MFSLKQFFNFSAATPLKQSRNKIAERADGSLYFHHFERNKYAPWGRGIKTPNPLSGTKVKP